MSACVYLCVRGHVPRYAYFRRFDDVTSGHDPQARAVYLECSGKQALHSQGPAILFFCEDVFSVCICCTASWPDVAAEVVYSNTYKYIYTIYGGCTLPMAMAVESLGARYAR